MSSEEHQESGFSADDIIPRLVSDFGYSQLEARSTAEQLVESDPRIRAVFWWWWQGGPIDDMLRIEGYTARRLATEEGLHPVAAFATLDWIQRDPKQALSLIHGGHDEVVIRESN